jgi:predicted MFS family arabinose efflux permease
MGILNSPHNTLLNAEIPSEARSSMLSISSLAGYLGSMLGSAGLGFIAERGSIGLAWGICGAVLVVSLILYWKVDLRQSQQRTPLPETLADAA